MSGNRSLESVTVTYPMVPLSGRVMVFGTETFSNEVCGFATEFSGFEFVRVWITPVQGGPVLFSDWTATQWDTGLRIGTIVEPSPELAAQACHRLLMKKGKEMLRQILGAVL